jgi:hypothetical protein
MLAKIEANLPHALAVEGTIECRTEPNRDEPQPMNSQPSEILESPRLPALYAAVLRYAGVATPPESTTDHFTVRSGAEPPGLLEEAMFDEAVGGWPGSLSVAAGFGSSCPNADALRGSPGWWDRATVRGRAARRRRAVANGGLGRCAGGIAARDASVPRGFTAR